MCIHKGTIFVLGMLNPTAVQEVLPHEIRKIVYAIQEKEEL
jgi:hypothetical protein